MMLFTGIVINDRFTESTNNNIILYYSRTTKHVQSENCFISYNIIKTVIKHYSTLRLAVSPGKRIMSSVVLI